jgi:hypothetical protein
LLLGVVLAEEGEEPVLVERRTDPGFDGSVGRKETDDELGVDYNSAADYSAWRDREALQKRGSPDGCFRASRFLNRIYQLQNLK